VLNETTAASSAVKFRIEEQGLKLASGHAHEANGLPGGGFENPELRRARARYWRTSGRKDWMSSSVRKVCVARTERSQMSVRASPSFDLAGRMFMVDRKPFRFWQCGPIPCRGPS
jgi:hypothetical protein